MCTFLTLFLTTSGCNKHFCLQISDGHLVSGRCPSMVAACSQQLSNAQFNASIHNLVIINSIIVRITYNVRDLNMLMEEMCNVI